MYQAYLAATIVSVVGGFIGIGLLWAQFGATKKAAEAALLNAHALANSQRAWIVVNGEKTAAADEFSFKGRCLGIVPAKIVANYAYETLIPQGTDLPLPPVYKGGGFLLYQRMVSQADPPFQVWEYPVSAMKHNPKLWDSISSLQKTLYFYGKVVYTDAVSVDPKGNPVLHETRWCYEYYFGGNILRSGPPEYNGYT